MPTLTISQAAQAVHDFRSADAFLGERDMEPDLCAGTYLARVPCIYTPCSTCAGRVSDLDGIVVGLWPLRAGNQIVIYHRDQTTTLLAPEVVCLERMRRTRLEAFSPDGVRLAYRSGTLWVHPSNGGTHLANLARISQSGAFVRRSDTTGY